ncbi:MAG: hypothetical protein ACRBN8_20860 [Nannocystales bacterium]
MTETPPTPLLRRALLHPVWLGAVAMLAINDHLLKGSGLVPGWFAGKLSDVVGLFAAPLLLAVLVRVRSRRGWAFAHVGIGAVFSAIQVSPVAADTWSGLMGMVGFPWSITSDLTDLLTLPALAISYVFVPRMAAQRVAHHVTGEVAVASAGMLCCVATSQVQEPFFGSFEADTYIHNANEFDIVLRIRPLKESAEFDCDLVEEDPARYLRDALFDDAQSWTLAADATMPVLELWDRPMRSCHAAWIDADNLAPSVVFWREGQYPQSFVDGTGITPDTTGWISVAFDNDGVGTYETQDDLVFRIGALAAPEPGACTPSSASSRLAWGDTPAGEWILSSVDEGLDGCVQVALSTGFEEQLDVPGTPWELCLPHDAFPFAQGDFIEVHDASTNGVTQAVALTRRDPQTGEPDTTLTALRSNGGSTVYGMQALIDPELSCEALPEEACGTVRRAVSVSMVGGGFESVSVRQDAEVPATTQSETETLELHLVHASERLVADTACDSGPLELGVDLELVAIRRARGGE